MTPNDYPLLECAENAKRLTEKGAVVYQKFTCEKCGSRQTIDKPNTFYTSASCEECGYVTDIAKNGCNFLLAATGEAGLAVLAELLGGEKK